MSLNATAKHDFKCPRCTALIRKGERLLMFRERATCYAEARNTGTMYPWRKMCATCAEGLNRVPTQHGNHDTDSKLED